MTAFEARLRTSLTREVAAVDLPTPRGFANVAARTAERRRSARVWIASAAAVVLVAVGAVVADRSSRPTSELLVAAPGAASILDPAGDVTVPRLDVVSATVEAREHELIVEWVLVAPPPDRSDAALVWGASLRGESVVEVVVRSFDRQTIRVTVPRGSDVDLGRELTWAAYAREADR